MNSFENRVELSPADEAERIDLWEYWRIVWREKWGILGLVIVTVTATAILVNFLTPIYRSTATLLIEASQANVVSIEEIYGIDSSQREYFATQFEILNSRKIAEEVIQQLDLANNPEFDIRQRQSLGDIVRQYLPFLPAAAPVTEEQIWQLVVDKFQENLTIQPIRNTQLVKISFESSQPELTFKVANALGEAYIDNNLESRLTLTQKAANWLTERLGGMRSDLEQAERNLQEFREKENLVDVSGVGTITANELDDVQQRFVESRNRAAELKNQLDAVGGSSNSYESRWETLPGVLKDQLAQRLKESEGNAAQELSEISQRYGPKHPKRIAAISKLEEARDVFRRQVKNVVSGFEDAYKQALADRRELERALDQSKSDIQAINRKRYELSQLEREVQTNRQLYDLFFTRFKETNTAAFEAANARFVDKAVKPYSAEKPRKLIILMLAMILSSVLGMILAFLRDALDNTIKSPADVESKLGQPVIGVLPILELDKSSNALPMAEAVLDSSSRSFSEAVRTARTSIVLSGIDRSLKKIVVTSSVPGEGKTTTSTNLALAFGQMEKVLLVDADMRRPSIAENCQLSNQSPGLSNCIAGTTKLSDCIYSYKGIDIMPAGTLPPNPLELISSSRFDELLGVLSESYDRIVIDSAPTQAVSDSLVLSSKADGAIYVVKSDSTVTQVVSEGLRRLARHNTHILGVVLNQFDAENAARYGGNGEGYYDYYGYGSSKSY